MSAVAAIRPLYEMDADELVEHLAEQEGDDRDLATGAVARLNEGLVRTLAVDLLADGVRRARRGKARAIEQRAAVDRLDQLPRFSYEMTEEQRRQDDAALAARLRASEEWWERHQELRRAFSQGEITFDQLHDAISQLMRKHATGCSLEFHSRCYQFDFRVTASFKGIEASRWVTLRGDTLRSNAGRRHRLQMDRERYASALTGAYQDARDEHARREMRVAAGFSETAPLRDDLRLLLDRFRAAVRLDVTEELLATTFSVGGGREVTWGEATVADHQARIDAQVAHAAGTLEDVQRHAAAIELLNESGVSCLAEVIE